MFQLNWFQNADTCFWQMNTGESVPQLMVMNSCSGQGNVMIIWFDNDGNRRVSDTLQNNWNFITGWRFPHFPKRNVTFFRFIITIPYVTQGQDRKLINRIHHTKNINKHKFSDGKRYGSTIYGFLAFTRDLPCPGGWSYLTRVDLSVSESFLSNLRPGLGFWANSPTWSPFSTSASDILLSLH